VNVAKTKGTPLPLQTETSQNETRPASPRRMLLPVTLSPDEVAARSKTLTGLIDEERVAQLRLDDFTESAKDTKKRMESDVDTLRWRIRDLATVVRNAREDRDVEVYEDLDFRAGVVLLKRRDTDELVDSRGMTEAERQRSLFKSEPGGAVTAETGA
jgi:hypothetical protein